LEVVVAVGRKIPTRYTPGKPWVTFVSFSLTGGNEGVWKSEWISLAAPLDVVPLWFRGNLAWLLNAAIPPLAESAGNTQISHNKHQLHETLWPRVVLTRYHSVPTDFISSCEWVEVNVRVPVMTPAVMRKLSHD
jgi:hypothetical protein